MKTLEGKVALVTGAGRGIGLAIAKKLSSAGARLVLNDLDAAVAQEAERTLRQTGGAAVAVPGDVTKPDFADRFVAAAVDHFGALDIIVNNAGYSWDAILQRTSDEQWEAMLAVHLTAPFRLLRAAQPVIASFAKAEASAGGPMGRRSVINISSIAAIGGNVGQAGYASGKAGILGLTRTVAKEWGRLNVTVNAVVFGIIDTRMTRIGEEPSTIDVGGREIRAGMSHQLQSALSGAIPLGRAGTTAEAAGAVYLLCQEEAAFITGSTLECTGGYNL